MDTTLPQSCTPLFKRFSLLRHYKGGFYVVLETPETCRHEPDGMPCYAYVALKDGSVWTRPQPVMEEVGKFNIVFPGTEEVWFGGPSATTIDFAMGGVGGGEPNKEFRDYSVIQQEVVAEWVRTRMSPHGLPVQAHAKEILFPALELYFFTGGTLEDAMVHARAAWEKRHTKRYVPPISHSIIGTLAFWTLGYAAAAGFKLVDALAKEMRLRFEFYPRQYHGAEKQAQAEPPVSNIISLRCCHCGAPNSIADLQLNGIGHTLRFHCRECSGQNTVTVSVTAQTVKI